jgi:hypothetical protein
MLWIILRSMIFSYNHQELFIKLSPAATFPRISYHIYCSSIPPYLVYRTCKPSLPSNSNYVQFKWMPSAFPGRERLPVDRRM